MQKRTRWQASDRPHLSGFRHDVVGNRHKFTFRVEITAIQTEPGVGNYSIEAHLRSLALRDKYAEAMKEIMNDEAMGYIVEIKTYLQ